MNQNQKTYVTYICEFNILFKLIDVLTLEEEYIDQLFRKKYPIYVNYSQAIIINGLQLTDWEFHSFEQQFQLQKIKITNNPRILRYPHRYSTMFKFENPIISILDTTVSIDSNLNLLYCSNEYYDGPTPLIQ